MWVPVSHCEVLMFVCLSHLLSLLASIVYFYAFMLEWVQAEARGQETRKEPLRRRK